MSKKIVTGFDELDKILSEGVKPDEINVLFPMLSKDKFPRKMLFCEMVKKRNKRINE